MERQFDRRIVVNAYIDEINRILSTPPPKLTIQMAQYIIIAFIIIAFIAATLAAITILIWHRERE